MTRPAALAQALWSALALLLATAPAVAQDRLAITPVTVVNVTDGSLLPDQTVLLDILAPIGSLLGYEARYPYPGYPSDQESA